MAVPVITPAVGVVISQAFLVDVQLTTAELVELVKFRLPQKAKILACSVVSRAKGGTHAATTFEFQAGTNVLCNIDVTAVAAGTRADGTVSSTYAVCAKDTEITVDFAETGGNSPTLDDVTIQIDYIPVP